VGQPIWLQAGFSAGWTPWKGRPQAELPTSAPCRAAFSHILFKPAPPPDEGEALPS